MSADPALDDTRMTALLPATLGLGRGGVMDGEAGVASVALGVAKGADDTKYDGAALLAGDAAQVLDTEALGAVMEATTTDGPALVAGGVRGDGDGDMLSNAGGATLEDTAKDAAGLGFTDGRAVACVVASPVATVAAALVAGMLNAAKDDTATSWMLLLATHVGETSGLGDTGDGAGLGSGGGGTREPLNATLLGATGTELDTPTDTSIDVGLALLAREGSAEIVDTTTIVNVARGVGDAGALESTTLALKPSALDDTAMGCTALAVELCGLSVRAPAEVATGLELRPAMLDDTAMPGTALVGLGDGLGRTLDSRTAALDDTATEGMVARGLDGAARLDAGLDDTAMDI